MPPPSQTPGNSKNTKPWPPDGVRTAIVLPPREGFSPRAVGAIGLLVQRLAAPEDLVIGQASPNPAFPGRHFIPAATPIWPPFGRVERYMAGVVKTLRPLRPDVIEVHNRANLAARVAEALPGARVMLFVHNDPQAMRGARSPAERADLLRRLTVVCVSAHLAGRFMDGVSSAASALVLPNALDLSDLPPPLPAGGRDAKILFVGRVVADKGADAFVRACAAVLPTLPGWQADIIGADRFWENSATTPFQRALLPQAQAAGIALRGYLPHADILQAMARAAIVVVPSRWPEPFGLTALEAMASGAALICSDRGGLPEVAGPAALYAAPDPPGPLEAAITRLATDAALRAQFATQGLARAKLFDAPRARERLLELRRELLIP